MKHEIGVADRFAAALLILSIPATSFAQSVRTVEPVEIKGLVVGRVYEIDKAKYKKYREQLEKQKKNPDETQLLDPDEYLVELPEAVVTARQLSTNLRFASEYSNGDGEYLIRDSPTGAFDFTIVHDSVEYSVRQRLDLNVELGYIAELCFVLDRDERVGWMISEGLRRDPDMPAFVPERCQSALSACLAMLIGDDGRFPQGLLLLLAGSGAAAASLGILATGQTEASPPNRR